MSSWAGGSRGSEIVKAVIGLLVSLLMVVASRADEPSELFLEALRREGLFDLADHYLERSASNPAVANEFKQRIPYEQAKTRFAALRNQLELRKRIEILASIEALLAKYSGPVGAEELPTAPLQLQMECALLRARLQAVRCKQAANDGEKKELASLADAAFEDALKASDLLLPKLRSFLEEIEKKPAADQQMQLRDQARKLYLDDQGQIPQIALERALLLPDGDKRREIHLRTAVEEFSKLMKKYSSRENYYLQFLLQSARCFALLGDTKEASSRYNEVLEVKGLPPAVTGRATAGLMNLWLQDPKLCEKAIPFGEAWLSTNPKESTDVVAPVQVALAKGLRQRMEQESPTNAKKSRKKIQELLSPIVQIPGEWGDEARSLRAEISGGDGGQLLATDIESLTDFATAFAEGQNAIGRMQSAGNGKGLLEDQLKIVKEGNQRSELEKGLEQANQEIAANRSAARQYLRRALTFVNSDVKDEELSQARFTLGYLLFTEGRLYEAAVLCEHTARNFTNTPQARLAARTALACYARMLEENPSSEFAKKRVLSLSQFCASRWPKEEDGRNAILTSLQLLVGMRDFGQAKVYLSQLPEQSEVRPEGELAMGAALYREYQLRRSEKLASGDGSAVAPEDMAMLLAEARGFLESGLAARGQAAATPSSVLAMIALAGVYFDQGEHALARALLEEPERGLLALANRHDSAVSRKGFREDIYRLALRAKIISMSQLEGAVNQNAVRDFKALMDSLAAAVEDSAEGKQRLFSNYVSLAKELRDSVSAAPANTRGGVADSFEAVLLQISSQSEDPQIVHWVAQSLVDLADTFPPKAGTLDVRAQRFLQEAEKSLRKIADLPAVRQDANLQLQTKLRIASILRRQHDFRGAIEFFAEVLAQRNQLLNVQVEAAQTYQEGKAFDYAIKGGRPDLKTGKNVIWGWESINHLMTKAVRSDPQNAEYLRLLHESRLQIATCRLLQGRAASGDRRQELLERAEKIILSVRSFDPTYGGETWRPKYDRLLREIQADLGHNGTGL